jgi:ATP-binding cassette subfamily B multidrug efflux pump
MSEEVKKKKIFEFSLLGRVFHYARPYKNRLYGSIALSILLAILAPLRPWLIQLTINNYIRPGALSPDISVKERMEIAIILFLLYHSVAWPDRRPRPPRRRL